MVFGKEGFVMSGSMKTITVGQIAALTLCSLMAAAMHGQTTPQQQVPDAPKPQTTLPRLNTITPVAPALPDTPPPPAPAKDPNDAPSTLGGDQEKHPDDDNTPLEGTTAKSIMSAPDVIEEKGTGSTDGSGNFKLGTVRVQFVEIPFTVKDSKGRLVPGIHARDVRVFENGARQPIRFFTTDPFPLSVALVIDQSVTQDTMSKINDSLRSLQGAFTPYDEVSVFTYNNGVTKQTSFTAAQSARLGAILERSKAPGREAVMPLGGPLASAGTKSNQQIDPNFNRNEQGNHQNYQEKEYHTLNDAILAAARETASAGKGRRRIVYVISDGKEYGSKAKEKDVIKYLQTNKVELYATLVGDSAVPGLGFLDRIHLPLTMRDDELPRIAAASGGQCDPEWRLTGIEKSFSKITEEVRTQYTLGYYTHESPFNERFRKVEVRVLRPGLNIIAKDGYYPTAADSRPSPVTPTAAP
jgi:VWFA-related protein